MIVLRSLLFNLIMYGSGIGLSVWTAFGPNRGAARALATGQGWSRCMLAVLRRVCQIEIKPQGLEHLHGGGALIAAQHQSALDILVWLTLLPRPTYVLKQELLRTPLFGPALRRAEMIAVDRGGGAAALRKMVRQCRAAIEDGRQIVIFPEGTRAAAGAPVQLQPGIVALAKALAVDVIPAGTDSGRYWSRKAFLKTPGAVNIGICPPVSHRLPREHIIGAIRGCFEQL